MPVEIWASNGTIKKLPVVIVNNFTLKEVRNGFSLS